MGRWVTLKAFTRCTSAAAGLLWCAVLLAACGGSGSGPAQAFPPEPPGPVSPATPALAGLPALASLDALVLRDGSSVAGTREASGMRPADFHGVYALAHSLHAAEFEQFALALAAPQPSPEYAIYGTGGLDSPVQLSRVKLTLVPADEPCTVAFADYAHGGWSLLTRGADGSFAPPAGLAPCASPAGRAYIAVLAYPQAVTVQFVHIDLDDGGALPAPRGLTVATRATGLHASWEAYNDPRRGFIHVRLSDAGGLNREEWLPRDAAEWDATGLTSGAQYTLEVQAADTQRQLGRGASASVTLPQGWQHTWNMGAGDEVRGLLAQPDGGVIAVGASVDATSTGGLLLRYGQAGTLAAARLWPGAQFDGVCAAPGGCIAYGRVPATAAGSSQALLLRLSGNGAVLWARTWSSAMLRNEPVAAACDTTGNTYLAIAPQPAVYSSTAFDGYVVKYSPAGELLWSRSWPSATRMELLALTAGTDGIYAGGYQYIEVDDPLYGSNPIKRALLLKLTAAGDLNWAQLGLGQDLLGTWWTGLAAAQDGGCFASGVLQDYEYKMLYVGGPVFSDGLAARFGPDGTPQWLNTYVNSSEQAFDFVTFNALAPDNTGGIYTLGYQSGGPLPQGWVLCHWGMAGATQTADCFVTGSAPAQLNALSVAGAQVYLGGSAQHQVGGWTPAGGSVTPADLTLQPAPGALVVLNATSVNVDTAQQGKAIAGTQDSALADTGAGLSQALVLSRAP